VFGKLPRVVVPKHSTMLMALLACTMLVPANADAADLRLRINPTAERHDATPPVEKRKQLFEQFLRWMRVHRPDLAKAAGSGLAVD
jgi:hypothetical protein